EQEYARAFHDYGVDIDALPVEVSVERLKARPALIIPIAVALDEWTGFRRGLSKITGSDDARWKRLMAVARGIDPEPLRDLIRSSGGRPDSETRDELRRLAESINVRAHHPATLYIAALYLLGLELPDPAIRVLLDAQAVYPRDFLLNDMLGSLYWARY